MWSGEKVDLEAYLARTGYAGGEPKPDLATLRELHRAHVARIPFENLEITLGRPVPLDLGALQDKLVRRRRGGYCYEQNSLFAAILERVGFSVTGLAARVLNGERDKLRPATHMLLLVEIDGQRWIIDVGFGGDGPQAPLALSGGAEVRQGAWTFSLIREPDDAWVLRTLRPDGWFDLYMFTDHAVFPPDYEVANYYVSTHPSSPFTSRPVVQRAEPQRRTALLGTRLQVDHPDGERDVRDIAEHEFGAVLGRIFGIDLSSEEVEVLRQRYRPISG
ncbi:arylamine N-acetyltransferase [Streptomyces sp. JJ66]|uniref:arylamine N-acetyltransferase family protein n=1 Tax=Streptomyces sp. JJ66 TaxID=2803843 RepID=UPI001C5A413E|nr:arylamine N-acetyltransferase [Streptomyces sp. JJ66]MBW1600835.1 arylamine N-acetyltransferase [Streptomyces sp. JJ66]